MSPKKLVESWVNTFNKANAYELAEFYAEDAINFQVNNKPIEGKKAIYEMFIAEFAQANMVCIIEQILEDGDWAILEWKDPLGLRGCGFFQIKNNKIVYQRGYWDKLSFLRIHGLPLPIE